MDCCKNGEMRELPTKPVVRIQRLMDWRFAGLIIPICFGVNMFRYEFWGVNVTSFPPTLS